MLAHELLTAEDLQYCIDIRRAIFSRLADRGYPILSMRSSEMTLEDIFLQLTYEEAKR